MQWRRFPHWASVVREINNLIYKVFWTFLNLVIKVGTDIYSTMYMTILVILILIVVIYIGYYIWDFVRSRYHLLEHPVWNWNLIRKSRFPSHFPDKLPPLSFTFIFEQIEKKTMEIQSQKKNQRNIYLILIISLLKYENIVAIKCWMNENSFGLHVSHW